MPENKRQQPTDANIPADTKNTVKNGVKEIAANNAKRDNGTEKPKEIVKAIRDGFGEGIMLAAKDDPNVVALCADLTDSDRLEEFKKTYPDRFVEVGIAEQNLIGVSCGMAHTGKVAFNASFAVFNPGRSWDQVRVSMCYSNANVKIYGGHAGITVGQDGATHQALEDVAILRCLPRITIIVPADAIEMRKATLAAAKTPGPFYLRGGREKFPQVTTEETPFEIGKAVKLRDGDDVTIIACGIMVREAMLAAEELAKAKITARVLDMHTIKPIDERAIIDAAHDTGAIVTAEEHQITGGLGGAVAEVLCGHIIAPLERVGVKDTFCESGNAPDLMDKYGLRAKDIVAAAKRAIDRKKGAGKRDTLKVSGSVIKRITKTKKR
ncbi:TPA: transketolase family protein [Candidatus Woesearchaeota archaeon]|nr:transketolase family protein [Candidatus Woesearchaeota archaeon]